MKVKEAIEITGGLSRPSKMPGAAYGLPAQNCKVGSQLHGLKDKNTVCSKCYALKGMYQFPAVQAAQRKRLESLTHPQWVEAMVLLIGRQKEKYFRWHDSGDLQGINHLDRICQVAMALPDVNFWLPTREFLLVAQYKKAHPIPPNLTIRLSAMFVDGRPPVTTLPTSTVYTKGQIPIHGVDCFAPYNDGKCGVCRMCWNPAIKNVSYREH